MKKAYLFCSAGMSTSLLATKMQEEANNRQLDFEILAYPISEIDNFINEIDFIVLGPQVRFMADEIRSKCNDKPVIVLPMNIYGLMDGEKALDEVINSK